MSYNRSSPNSGRCRRPDGLCRYCKQDVKRFDSRRRTFCSDACVHEWKIRSNPAYAREQVWLRDHGICTLCHLDTEKLIHDLRLATRGFFGPDRFYAEEMYFQQLGLEPINFLKSRRQTLWEMDHIVPVSAGGGECGLEGLRTLCLWCHRKKTAEYLGNRADYRG